MWGPAAVWAAVLFLLSAWPNPAGPSWLAVSDKVVHLVLFAVLGGALAFGRWWSGAPAPHALIVAVGIGYGALDEWHQAMVPNRTPSVADWYADIAGVLLGYALTTLLVISAGRMSGAGQRTD